MRSMAIDRRAVLRAAAGFGIGGLGITGLGLGLAAAARIAPSGSEGVRYVAARQQQDGGYVAAVFDLDTGDRALVPLPGRGHDVAVSPGGDSFVVFARRPGRFAIAVERDRPPVLFETPDDRHFYGHGCFSPEGDLLYATENDFHRRQGVIGIYQARSWRRQGELSTFGVGPHELLLLRDGRTLAVANGGIATDPGVGNGRTGTGDGVQSDLVLIDRRSGERRGQWRLRSELAELSIRHLALDRCGSIWFGGQWEGRADARPPLLGRLSATGAGALEVVDTTGIDGNLGNYVGSVAADRSGTLLAASSPRAGSIAVLNAASGRILAVVPLADGCGLAGSSGGRGFIATSGSGRVERLQVSGDKLVEEPLRAMSARWDNHLRRLPI